jgi:hypothetical protein
VWAASANQDREQASNILIGSTMPPQRSAAIHGVLGPSTDPRAGDVPLDLKLTEHPVDLP